MAKLGTRPWRVVAAIAVGLIAPSLVMGLMEAALMGFGSLGAGSGFGFGLGLVGAAILIVFPGLPIWFVLYRRRARARTAAAVGAVVTLLGMVSLILAAGSAVSVTYNSLMIIGNAVITAIATATGGLTSGLMWRITYPKALQPAAEAEVF